MQQQKGTVVTRAECPYVALIDIAGLAGLSPGDLADEIAEWRRSATEDGVGVLFAVDVTHPSDVAILAALRRAWPDVPVMECVGP